MMSIDFFPNNDNLNVLEENKDFLIVEKPAGLLVHPDKYSKERTLVDLIFKKYPETENIGQSGRGGIIHRLDRDVSGLMVVARTKETYERLTEQFQQRKVKKEYLALVYGEPSEDKGEIDLPLGRNKKGKIIAVLYKKKIKQEKPAKTRYEVIQKFSDPQKFSLLKVFLLTGRTHQIRAHLRAIGCPIVGDLEYKIKDRKLKTLPELKRVFLHAHCLGFYNRENVWQEFKTELPKELKEFLKELK